MNKILYTIGHSNISFSNFYKLLKHWGINCIIDVRSTPYSSYTKHFNKENLIKSFKEHNITYLHFKEEFGARPKEKAMYENGQVDFKKMIESNKFQEGVKRLKGGMQKNYKIALMCSCAHPLTCHRFFMISKYLVDKKELKINHIFPYNKDRYKNFIQENYQKEIAIEADKGQLNYFILSHQELEELDKKNHIPNLFDGFEDSYLKSRNEKIGYKI